MLAIENATIQFFDQATSILKSSTISDSYGFSVLPEERDTLAAVVLSQLAATRFDGNIAEFAGEVLGEYRYGDIENPTRAIFLVLQPSLAEIDWLLRLEDALLSKEATIGDDHWLEEIAAAAQQSA